MRIVEVWQSRCAVMPDVSYVRLYTTAPVRLHIVQTAEVPTLIARLTRQHGTPVVETIKGLYGPITRFAFDTDKKITLFRRSFHLKGSWY